MKIIKIASLLIFSCFSITNYAMEDTLENQFAEKRLSAEEYLLNIEKAPWHQYAYMVNKLRTTDMPMFYSSLVLRMNGFAQAYRTQANANIQDNDGHFVTGKISTLNELRIQIIHAIEFAYRGLKHAQGQGVARPARNS